MNEKYARSLKELLEDPKVGEFLQSILVLEALCKRGVCRRKNSHRTRINVNGKCYGTVGLTYTFNPGPLFDEQWEEFGKVLTEIQEKKEQEGRASGLHDWLEAALKVF